MNFSGAIFAKPVDLNFDSIVAYFLPLILLWGNKSTKFDFCVDSKLYSC